MKWNLLMDGVHSTRVGYAWMEFARRRADVSVEYVTLIIGLRATQQESGARTWFALLRDRRVGIDVTLYNEATDEPYTRVAFEAAVGVKTLQSASEYRRAVNDALFGFQSDERYETMLELQRQLRRSKLSESLNPDELSGILSKALPDIDADRVGRIGAQLDQIELLREAIGIVIAVTWRAKEFLILKRGDTSDPGVEFGLGHVRQQRGD